MNPSSRLATTLVESLAALGVRFAVVCPGSRSAPLAYAVAAADAAGWLRMHVRVDERGAGFLALGLAKESGVPAAVVVTSGTAVANLHPAVLEAAHSGVPLLVLSADRPHELRGTGASQTTDQVHLFGTAARLFAEVPAPDGRPGQEPGWRNLASRAVAAATGALGDEPGPVHLNLAFREPLVPGEPVQSPSAVRPVPVVGETAGLTRVPPAGPPPAHRLPAGPRTVVLAADGAGPAARELAEAAGWPLLAEPSSGARGGPNAIGPYRLLLAHPDLGAAVRRVVVFGHATLSRSVTALLGRDGVQVLVVSPRPRWSDPGLRAAAVLPAVAAPPEPADPAVGGWLAVREWLAAWRRAGALAAAAVDDVLDAEAAAGRLTGPLVAREVAAATEPGALLVVGPSNPIRDLDLAAPTAPGEPPTVLANRGLAGIDGVLSTAVGAALARRAAGDQRPARALVGDLTFLHDVGGLLIGPLESRPRLQVVVFDDGGGGIFSLLEHGQWADGGPDRAAVVERVFGTPPSVDLPALCAGYGVAYRRAKDLAGLRAALAGPPDGLSVVHVRADRAQQRPLAAQISAAVAEALG